MKPPSPPSRRAINSFNPNLLHTNFPKIDLFQLSPGSFEGWLLSIPMEHCVITAGSFNQAILCEGHYNPDIFHVGFILSPGHSAIVQAHEYNHGTLTIHRNAVGMHEAFPPNMAWVDISIPEQNIPQKIPPSITDRIQGRSKTFLLGSRKTLAPIIQWINTCINAPSQTPPESELQRLVNELLTNRLDDYDPKQDFSEGDHFRMHLLEITHLLAREKTPQTLSLQQICTASGMKPRTIQKYFRETYGMGPTEYFRMRRLNHARTDLLLGSKGVSEVALRWGFNHLGRFAGRYKTHFGENPKTTLERIT